MRCKHRCPYDVSSVDILNEAEPRVSLLGQRRCLDCGEVVPYAPSNDEPEAVKVEMRAVELADRLRRIKRFPVLYSSLRFNGAEIAGHITYISNSAKQPEQDGEWSGYLAAAITTHQDPTE